MGVPLFDTEHTARPPARDDPRAHGRGGQRTAASSSARRSTAFEQEFAGHLGASHAVGVANGTDALTLALRAMGVGPGDDVVVPSFTFYASAEAIPPTGARPVFCDVDPDTGNVTAETVRAALTPNTKAVVAVHLFGNVAPIAEIEALGVPVVEDAAQAAGSTSAARARRARSARSRRSRSSRRRTSAASATVARSSRATRRSPRASACCASTARATRTPSSRSASTPAWTSCRPRSCACSCRTWTTWADGRRAAARHYDAGGHRRARRSARGQPGCAPAWHLYVVRHERADALVAALGAAGIGARAYYRVPIHRQPAMREWAAWRRSAGDRRARRAPISRSR